MFTIFKKFLWPSVLHSTDGSVLSHNGGSMKARYGWRRWEQWCVAFDMDVGQVITFVDGEEDGSGKNNADDNFNSPLERANKKKKGAILDNRCNSGMLSHRGHRWLV